MAGACTKGRAQHRRNRRRYSSCNKPSSGCCVATGTHRGHKVSIQQPTRMRRFCRTPRRALANKASGHQGRGSPSGRAGAITAGLRPTSSSPAMPRRALKGLGCRVEECKGRPDPGERGVNGLRSLGPLLGGLNSFTASDPALPTPWRRCWPRQLHDHPDARSGPSGAAAAAAAYCSVPMGTSNSHTLR